jgi:cytosine deaminase
MLTRFIDWFWSGRTSAGEKTRCAILHRHRDDPDGLPIAKGAGITVSGIPVDPGFLFFSLAGLTRLSYTARMIPKFITSSTPVDDAVLNLIAHLPTEFLPKIAEPAFFAKLSDRHFMRIGTLLAQKSFDEGGCPIGGVIIDAASRQIIGKGHNTLGQENDSTTHGETAALRDAGRVAKLRGDGPVDFRKAIMFTTLTPCLVCCAQIIHRGNFVKVVIGDVTNAPTTAPILRQGGISEVVELEDPQAVALYARYAKERPMLHFIDWAGHKKWDEARGSGLA